MEFNEIEGKTIESVKYVFGDFSDSLELIFTDGTQCSIDPTGDDRGLSLQIS